MLYSYAFPILLIVDTTYLVINQYVPSRGPVGVRGCATASPDTSGLEARSLECVELIPAEGREIASD